jgi:DNA-binding beta-propeller fold protein YncE
MVTTIGGSPGQASGADGVGSDARFNQPTGVAVDSLGNVYVVDSEENRVSKGTPAGATTTVSFDTSVGGLTISGGAFKMRVSAPSSGSLILDMSTNLQSWVPIQTNPLSPSPLILSVPFETNQNRFFRARLEP